MWHATLDWARCTVPLPPALRRILFLHYVRNNKIKLNVKFKAQHELRRHSRAKKGAEINSLLPKVMQMGRKVAGQIKMALKFIRQ